MLKRIAGALAFGFIVCIVSSACGGTGDSSLPPDNNASTTFKVALLDTMAFDPSVITVHPGASVTIELTNKGTLLHNFSIEGLKVNVDVAPGDTETTTFTAPTSPGEHKIFCDVVGHEGAGMVGAFVVQE